MTFEQFQSTARVCEDIGAHTGIDDYDGMSGILYSVGPRCDDLVLAYKDGKWWDEYADEYVDLVTAERHLYDFAVGEGYL
jgi:hypothetical protein